MRHFCFRQVADNSDFDLQSSHTSIQNIFILSYNVHNTNGIDIMLTAAMFSMCAVVLQCSHTQLLLVIQCVL